MRNTVIMRILNLLLVCVILMVTCTGCGGEKDCVVTGTASWKGEPIQKGMIDFEPVDGLGKAVSGEIFGGDY